MFCSCGVEMMFSSMAQTLTSIEAVQGVLLYRRGMHRLCARQRTIYVMFTVEAFSDTLKTGLCETAQGTQTHDAQLPWGPKVSNFLCNSNTGTTMQSSLCRSIDKGTS